MHNGGARGSLLLWGFLNANFVKLSVFREVADFYGGVEGKGLEVRGGYKKIDCLTTTNLN